MNADDILYLCYLFFLIMPFCTKALDLLLPRLVDQIPSAVIASLRDLVDHFPSNSLGKTPLRLAHFISQCAHESAWFTKRYEVLNYSADALQRQFPKYFPNQVTADLYAGNERCIASRMYANRMGNGDEASQDGYLFRGRGYIQLTGRRNYVGFSRFVGVDCVRNPDWVAQRYPLLSAAFFFAANDLWSVCDHGYGVSSVLEMTRRINGGINGLNQRISLFQYFLSLLIDSKE
jgi:putative chitinase